MLPVCWLGSKETGPEEALTAAESVQRPEVGLAEAPPGAVLERST